MVHPALAPMAIPRQRTRRGWWRFHPVTLFIGLALQLHLGYLLSVDHVNPVPEPGQLVQVPVEVLKRQKRVPHLQVRLADDTHRRMEFPVSEALLAYTFTPMDGDELDSLPGCMGYVLGLPMRWVSGERFRVWELHCGPVHQAYADFKASFEAGATQAQRAKEWHGGVILFLTLMLLWLERRVLRRWGLV